MGSTNYGNQIQSIQYAAPADAVTWNKLMRDVQSPGLYAGGLLTKISDISVSLSALVCSIKDANYQLRIETQAAVTVAVTSSTPYVILRWAYSASATNYMDVMAVSLINIQANDVVVGLCTYSGSTLLGFDYSVRTSPISLMTYCKVTPTATPSLYLSVGAGVVSLGDSPISVVAQTTSVFTAPTTNPRWDLVAVNSSGAIVVVNGTEAASPTRPSPGSYIPLAYVYMTVGKTSIVATDLVDVRPFLSLGGYANDPISFTNASLSSGVLTVTHNLSKKYVTVQVYDNNDEQVIPDTIDLVNTNSLTIDFSSYGTITGTWNVVVKK